MSEKLKLTILYAVSAIFIVLNLYFIVHKDMYFFLLVPLGLALAALYLFSIDKVILLIVMLTPLAVNIRDFEMGFGISLPTEPLMFGVLVMFFLKLLKDNNYDRRIKSHPVTILVLISLVWIFFTTLTSQLPLVSFKFLLARLWFVIPFFFAAIIIFKNIKNIRIYTWLYMVPLIIVIFYTIFRHAQYGFDEQAGHWVMDPFYNDHTAYGAILAMLVPIFVGFSAFKQYNKRHRMFAMAMTGILLIALFLSASRAAWISVVAAFGVYLLIVFKIRFRWVFISIATLIGLFFTFQFEIVDMLERNKQDSSADFVEHVQSIANISSDASNLERINRWQSGLRMFHERPVLGWGPGTYQFFYAPFQRSKEKTIISTNAGDMGNAHSEYIGPLAEQGMPGMIIIILLVIYALRTGFKVYREAENKEIKMLSLVFTLSLITYFTHGLLNNFLDSDKASVLVWGFIAILVSMDLYHRDQGSRIKDHSKEIEA